MKDFTFKRYSDLLKKLHYKNNSFITFENFINTEGLNGNSIILRHDVDLLPQNSLKTAQIENVLGIKGTYYFRVVPESYDLKIMEEIASLGHEIGYHYEDVDLAARKIKSAGQRAQGMGREAQGSGLRAQGVGEEMLIDMAYESFCRNLEMFRKNFDIKTVCMHGSPRAKHDNKIIWSRSDAYGKKYNYRDLGIIGEPYFDINFDEFAYFTDTGRRWNGDKVSVRDKVNSKYSFNFKTTQQIIDNIDKLPPKIMFTIHPQRWHDAIVPWTKELVMQNVKNVVKGFIVKIKDKSTKIKL